MRKQNPWLTPTESFESDETKEEPLRAPPGFDGPMRDGLRAFFRSPPGLPDPPARSQALGGSVQAESRLLPRLQQMKGVRPFDGTVSDKCSEELECQKRLSLLCWNAGPRRGGVTSRILGHFHVTMVQEVETHCSEKAKAAEQQFHVYQGADQLILFHKNTFELGGVMKYGEIPGASKHDSLV